jgi:hypothetical protein
MKTRARIITTVLAALSAAFIAVPPAGAVTYHPIASCKAHGQFATCVAAGNANHPHNIYVHVRSYPRQGAYVAWTMVCVKGSGAGSTSGHFSTGTPINRRLRKPYYRPDSCTVSADAQLKHGGHLHLWLNYTN